GLADAEPGAAIAFRHRDAEPAVARAGLVKVRGELAALVMSEPVIVAEALAELGDRLADSFLFRREGEVHQLVAVTLSNHAFPLQLGDLAVVEAQLNEDLARVLTEPRRASRDLTAAATVGPHRELGVAALGGVALLELRMFRRLGGRDAEIHGHVVLRAAAHPFRGRLAADHLRQATRELVAVRAPLGIAREALIRELRRKAQEVLPEVFFQDAKRQALAIRGLEHIVHREEMRARIDVAIEAVAHGGEEKGGLEERQIEICAFALAQRRQQRDRGKGAARHVGDRQRRARRGFEPLAGKGEAARCRDVVDVMPGPFAPRAGLPVARDGAVDQFSVVRPQGVVVDAEALRHARSKTLDHHVRVRGEPRYDVNGIRVLEIEGDAALVPILGLELHRHISAPRIAARRLDLDHIRAEVREDRRGERTRNEHREVDHAHATQRQPRLSHGASCHARPALARLAASRSRLFAVSTTKRTCLPRPHSSIGSRTVNSNVTRRRSTSTIFTSIVTLRPSGVAARWSIETCAPTESSPASSCCSRKSRQVYSTSLTMRGVAYTMPSLPMKPMQRLSSTVTSRREARPTARLAFMAPCIPRARSLA